ncbi:MAG: DNA-directed RNA polymerase subunit omega [Actinomycetales bacterium]|nr:DNA-directed RNA polymerase subunit omega [Actinomycetales bacterium]
MASDSAVGGGITHPPVDELVALAGSKYQLVIWAAKRARQINAYYAQLGEGLLEYVGPLVETHPQEKALSVSLREIRQGLLSMEPVDPETVAANAAIDGLVQFAHSGLGSEPSAVADPFRLPEAEGNVVDLADFRDDGSTGGAYRNV